VLPNSPKPSENRGASTDPRRSVCSRRERGVHDVVIVGAGPVGMLLAGRLHRAGLDVVVLERRPEASPGSRAIGLHAPVLAALEASGVTERLLADALRVERGEARSRGRLLGEVRFDRLPTRFPFVATLPQPQTRAALAVDAPEPVRGTVVAVHGGIRPRVRYDTHDGPRELGLPHVVVEGHALRVHDGAVVGSAGGALVVGHGSRLGAPAPAAEGQDSRVISTRTNSFDRNGPA